MLDARLFLKLLQLELRAHPPDARVVKVRLEAEPVKPRPAQGGLFLPATPAPDRLELTLARLAGIVGEQKIGAAEVRDTDRPDAFQMKRFAPVQAQSRHREIRPSGDVTDHPIIRSADSMHSVTALRRFRPPLAAEVELRAGEPARIAAGEIRGEVASISGPWRTSGNWWKAKTTPASTDDHGSSWARDELDIALRGKQGIALFRIYREVESGAWFVEGSYD
jgi:protein ImuB